MASRCTPSVAGDGGIALLPGYRTDVTGLTADESRALFILAAQGAHSALGLDSAFRSALRKVMAALPEPHRPAAELTSRRILVEASRWRGGPMPAVDLGVLQEAVLAERRLRLRYRHSGTDTPRTYTVDPYGLVSKAGVWYLVADRRAAPQLFRADRVREATLTDAPVRRRPGVQLADAWAVLKRQVEDRPGAVEATARVRRTHLDLFLRLCGNALTAPPDDDGHSEWIIVRLGYGEVREARSLLSFADNVEVTGPPEIREELARCAAAITGVYGPPTGTP